MKIQLRLKSINLAKGILKALTKHQVGNKIEFKSVPLKQRLVLAKSGKKGDAQ